MTEEIKYNRPKNDLDSAIVTSIADYNEPCPNCGAKTPAKGTIIICAKCGQDITRIKGGYATFTKDKVAHERKTARDAAKEEAIA